MKRYNFIATDFVAPINAVSVSPTNFVSQAISLKNIWAAALTAYIKGTHASCAGIVTFVFVAWDSLRGMWDTTTYFTTTMTMIGTTPLQKTVTFDPCPEAIKLLSIANPETTSGYTVTANASLLCHFV